MRKKVYLNIFSIDRKLNSLLHRTPFYAIRYRSYRVEKYFCFSHTPYILCNCNASLCELSTFISRPRPVCCSVIVMSMPCKRPFVLLHARPAYGITLTTEVFHPV